MLHINQRIKRLSIGAARLWDILLRTNWPIASWISFGLMGGRTFLSPNGSKTIFMETVKLTVEFSLHMLCLDVNAQWRLLTWKDDRFHTECSTAAPRQNLLFLTQPLRGLHIVARLGSGKTRNGGVFKTSPSKTQCCLKQNVQKIRTFKFWRTAFLLHFLLFTKPLEGAPHY